MFYHLLYPLRDLISAFNIFRYITFRSAYAAVTALLISFLLGPIFIRMLKRRQLTEGVREYVPESHAAKAGTPTMGGLLILVATLVPTILWARLDNDFIWIMVFATVWLGAVGFADDYLKVVKKRRKGLVARYKLTGQLALGLLIGLYIYYSHITARPSEIEVPFLKNAVLSLGPTYVLFVMMVITASSNAVNLTDGLDGLAIGLVVFCALAFAAMSYVTGHVRFSDYLNIPYIAGTGELAVYCSALIGAGLGFLWFNAHPADIFMGDTGSLAVGGALGTLAVLIKKEIWLVIVGGLFVVIAASVIIQILSFKLRGRRVFLMAPLHHHFQKRGWPESKVVIRFWIVGALFALLSLSTLKLQ
ncbi:MAG: phospho-N-acetylmuramoyl-pentapeptide-transferase [Candidatus Eisenbacteria bacterium]|nr:phospho-N-acetylmuramoyl-pentapeptide-transferase [Candidatus Eisenbacteria bacterium]